MKELSKRAQNPRVQRNVERLMDSVLEGRDSPPRQISLLAGNFGMRRILETDLS